MVDGGRSLEPSVDEGEYGSQNMQKEQDATIEDAEADFQDGEELNFSHNSLSADKLEVLGDAVTASKARAISLNLSWCQIGPLECTTLGKAMARSSALAELHLCRYDACMHDMS